MKRLSENPIELFTGRATMATPTFYAESQLKYHSQAFRLSKDKVVMPEVCTIVSEWQDNQPDDEDKQPQMQITKQSTNSRKAIDNQLVLWKRKDNWDLGAVGAGGMQRVVERDDLTVNGKGEIWPKKLFVGVDTDIGLELMTAIVAGYGYLVEMTAIEALSYLRNDA